MGKSNNDEIYKSVKLCRLNVNLEQSVKEWYQWRARTMGMNMCQLMSYVLTSYHDTQVQVQVMRDVRDLCEDKDFRAENREMYQTLANILKEGKFAELQEVEENKSTNKNTKKRR